MGAQEGTGSVQVLRRKPLGPGFRMAVLAGAIESVRLHLHSGVDINAVDEKGRSPLILAASKGRLDICKLLLEKGADPTLKDGEGKDALDAALFRGQVGVAALLHEALIHFQQFRCCNANGDPSHGSGVHNIYHDNDHLYALNCVPVKVDDPPILSNNEQYSENDRAFDLSVWKEENETAIPVNDLACADQTSALQTRLSRHIPVDTDENWNDIEIELPELHDIVCRRFPLSTEKRQGLRALFIEALRDGRIRDSRIAEALSEEDGLGNQEQMETERNLHLVLGELGALIDDDVMAPDISGDVGEAEEERYGDDVTDALSFFGGLQSSNVDSLTLYFKELPADRLTREDETALGMAIEDAMVEVLTAITGSSAVVSRLLLDAQAVLKGEMLPRAMFAFTVTGEELDEEAVDEEVSNLENCAVRLPAEIQSDLTSIINSCRLGHRDELVRRLFSADILPEYLVKMRRLAEEYGDVEVIRRQIIAGTRKAEKAKKRLVEANLKLVIWVSKKYGGLSLSDRIQEGNIGLMRAADRFDPRRGKFSTYAVH